MFLLFLKLLRLGALHGLMLRSHNWFLLRIQNRLLRLLLRGHNRLLRLLLRRHDRLLRLLLRGHDRLLRLLLRGHLYFW